MSKITIMATTAFLIAASPVVLAQDISRQHPPQPASKDISALTDARIAIVKATLQLTPEQSKYWPAVEEAIRSRSKNRQARISKRLAEIGDRSPIEIIHDRNPVEFLNRRADLLNQRAADLKKLAGAWEPLYKTLAPDQKQRMALLTLVVLRDVRGALEERRMQHEDEYEEEYE